MINFFGISVSVLGLSACGGGSGSGSESSSSSSSGSTGTTCLLGSWKPDLNSLADIQKNQLGAASATVSGEIVMRFLDSDRGETVVPSMVTNVTFTDQPSVTTTVSGRTDFTYIASDVDSTIMMETVDFQYVASADVLGERIEIPVNSDDGLFGSAVGTFTCSGNNLEIRTGTPQTNIAPIWTRID